MNLKRYDKYLYPILTPFAIAFRLVFFWRKPIEKNLILRPGGMGDLVLLTLCLKDKGVVFDQCHFLIEERSRVWAEHLSLDFTCYDSNLIYSLLRLSSRYMKVVNTEQLYGLSQIFAYACVAIKGELISFTSNRGSFLSSKMIGYEMIRHEMLNFSKLLEIGGYNSVYVPYMRQEVKDEGDIYTLWIAGIGHKSREVGVKTYLDIIALHEIKKIRIICDDKDIQYADVLKNEISKIAQVTIEKNNFDRSVEALKQSQGLISVDGGPVHIASYYNKKVICVFTSGVIEKWHPLVEKSLVYSRDLACSPCNRFGTVPKCNNAYECKNIKINKFSRKIIGEDYYG